MTVDPCPCRRTLAAGDIPAPLSLAHETHIRARPRRLFPH